MEVADEIPCEWRRLIAQMLKASPDKRISLSAAESVLKGGTDTVEIATATDSYLTPAGDLI